MSIPNPLLKFVPSEFTEGIFRAETKFGTVTLVGNDRDDKFSLFGPVISIEVIILPILPPVTEIETCEPESFGTCTEDGTVSELSILKVPMGSSTPKYSIF